MVSSFIQFIRSTTATNKLLLLLHPFPPRCCSRVPERAQLGLCSHIPDALHPAAVYVALRHVAIRLQRPSLHLRWLARGGDSQGMWSTANLLYTFQTFVPFLYTLDYSLVGPFCARFLPRRVACNERPPQCCQQWLYNRLFMGHPHTHTRNTELNALLNDSVLT